MAGSRLDVDLNRLGKPLAQDRVCRRPLPDQPHSLAHRVTRGTGRATIFPRDGGNHAAGISERNGGASSDGMVICIMATGGMSIPNCNAGRSFYARRDVV